MNTTIAIVGATGNLGHRIVRELAKRGAQVKAVVRKETDAEKIDKIKGTGVEIIKADMDNNEELRAAFTGAAVVVSALQGLRDVIVDTQANVLEAAIAAGVPRFISSDFSTDYTQLTPGENRNFDLRREFYQQIDKAPIKATSIFNGAFADILAYSAPFMDMKGKAIGYWDDANHKIDMTTMDDTAAFTAAAVMDDNTPRKLLIAGFQTTPNELRQAAEEVLGEKFELKNMGSVSDFAEQNKADRAAHPEGENEVFPRWQGKQYLQSMFSTHHAHLDNDRYTGIEWTDLKTVLDGLKNQKGSH